MVFCCDAFDPLGPEEDIHSNEITEIVGINEKPVESRSFDSFKPNEDSDELEEILVSVTLPHGVSPGQKIEVRSPDGQRTVDTVVPDGLKAGQTFLVRFPPSPDEPVTLQSVSLPQEKDEQQDERIDEPPRVVERSFVQVLEDLLIPTPDPDVLKKDEREPSATARQVSPPQKVEKVENLERIEKNEKAEKVAMERTSKTKGSHAAKNREQNRITKQVLGAKKDERDRLDGAKTSMVVNPERSQANSREISTNRAEISRLTPSKSDRVDAKEGRAGAKVKPVDIERREDHLFILDSDGDDDDDDDDDDLSDVKIDVLEDLGMKDPPDPSPRRDPTPNPQRPERSIEVHEADGSALRTERPEDQERHDRLVRQERLQSSARSERSERQDRLSLVRSLEDFLTPVPDPPQPRQPDSPKTLPSPSAGSSRSNRFSPRSAGRNLFSNRETHMMPRPQMQYQSRYMQTPKHIQTPSPSHAPKQSQGPSRVQTPTYLQTPSSTHRASPSFNQSPGGHLQQSPGGHLQQSPGGHLQQSPGQKLVQVQVPPGLPPGSTIFVEIPGENRTVAAQVPPHVSSFHVAYTPQSPGTLAPPTQAPAVVVPKPHAGREKLLSVRVPPGTPPGTTLHVSVPDEPGRILAAQVPPGNVTKFHVSYTPSEHVTPRGLLPPANAYKNPPTPTRTPYSRDPPMNRQHDNNNTSSDNGVGRWGDDSFFPTSHRGANMGGAGMNSFRQLSNGTSHGNDYAYHGGRDHGAPTGGSWEGYDF